MRKIIINGGKKLQGEVTVSGAKNSVVALIPAIILSDGVVTLDGVPAISDVDNLIEIIELMGGSVKRDGETLEIDPRGVKDMPMPFGKISRLRAQGRTVIENAAREPEIIDVATLLNNMGAHVRGAGTEVITIDGVDSLHGTRHQVIPDRIEAGSYIAMAAAIGKGIKIKNVLYEHLESFIAKLESMGVRMTVEEDSIFVEEQFDLKPVDIKTSPYPGFATDLQGK